MNLKASTSARKALLAGIHAGFLPDDAAIPPGNSRPWPVILLTAIGAWFAAIPLFLLMPGVNYLGRSASIILAGGSEA